MPHPRALGRERRRRVPQTIGQGAQLAGALANLGNTSTHPLIRLEGPVTDPVLVNAALDRTLEFDVEVLAGEILEIDTDNGTVTLDDANAMSTLTGTSVPVQDFVLAAGSNPISYAATAGGSNGADFLWRDSYL